MKNISKFLILAVSVLLFSGCDGFLDEKPVIMIDQETALSNFERLHRAVAGAYAPLAGIQFYGGNRIEFAEMACGNGHRYGDYQSGRLLNQYAINYNYASTVAAWQHGYYMISMVNSVIEKLPGVDEATVTQQDIDNLHAECLFLRALIHFDLVRLYAQPYSYQPNSLGVPIILTPQGLDEKPSRATVKAVYDQVVKDLLDAEKLMSLDYIAINKRGGTDYKAAATHPAIQALLSRVYLNMGEWQKCADYSTKVINNEDFNMWTVKELPEVWKRKVAGNGGEVIFEVYGEKNNAYDRHWEGLAHMTDPAGYGDFGASLDIYNLYDEDDIRKTLFRRPLPDNPKFKPGQGHENYVWTAKYSGKNEGRPDLTNVIVLRLSEMYINRAEAILNGATVAGVTTVSDMNMIASNRNVELFNSVGSEDVFTERRKEFAFEGHLWYDYSRTGRKMVRNHYDGSLNKEIDFPSYKWALPLPKSQIDINENLEQNPGY